MNEQKLNAAWNRARAAKNHGISFTIEHFQMFISDNENPVTVSNVGSERELLNALRYVAKLGEKRTDNLEHRYKLLTGQREPWLYACLTRLYPTRAAYLAHVFACYPLVGAR